MFFYTKITGIRSSDYVLEVGPGSTPHHRSDILLEKIYDDPETENKQRGLTPPLNSNKRIVYYDGSAFPFGDKEFDYVICSHVLEHVDDVDFFLSEIVRVGTRGYIEYPNIYYEYLYNFRVHKNVIKRRDDVICWLRKSDTALDDFFEVQKFFYESLVAGHNELVSSNLHLFFEGFEWEGNVRSARVYDIREVCMSPDSFYFGKEKVEAENGSHSILRRLLKRLLC